MKTGNGAVRGIGRNDDLRLSGRYERRADINLTVLQKLQMLVLRLSGVQTFSLSRRF